MARLPKALARRIDRLARAGHRFHRFAHHPLCGRYADEVVRIGRRGRVCRGCLMAGIGATCGVGVGAAVAIPLWLPVVALGAGGTAGLAALSFRRPQDPAGATRRRLKLLSRAIPLGLLTFTGAAGVRLAILGALLPGLSLLAGAAALVALLTAYYRRRGPDRRPCLTCPERTSATPCSGLAPVIHRERAVRRLAGRWLDAAGL